MPTTWQWLQYRYSMPAPSVTGNSQLDKTIEIPAGRNVQRVITGGGFMLPQIITGQGGGRQQSQAIVWGQWRIDAGPTTSTMLTRTWQDFLWQRSGAWSQGATSLQATATAYAWQTPPRILDFDADIRFSGGGGGGVRVFLSYVSVGNTTEGLVGPTNAASGDLFIQILTSGE